MMLKHSASKAVPVVLNPVKPKHCCHQNLLFIRGNAGRMLLTVQMNGFKSLVLNVAAHARLGLGFAHKKRTQMLFFT
jgi:hypothetical protein